ncbi:MAG: CRTAC1 family protein [Verrucomicrobiota bacterium]
MIEELDLIKETTASTNPYLGDFNLRRAKSVEESLPNDASDIDRATALGYLGWYQLGYGLVSEAIESLETSRQLFARSGAPSYFPEYRNTEGSLILAYLRLAETENCCAMPSPDSCIFPISGEGIHTKDRGAKRALELLKSRLNNLRDGEMFGYEERWLANLAVMAMGAENTILPESWRIPESALKGTESGFPKFRNVAASLGVDTYGLAGGSVADDFDGDGIYDLLVSEWDSTKGMRFFRGIAGEQFEDQTQAANLEGLLGGLNIKQADFDNDGDLDVYIMRGAWLGNNGRHPNSLLRNDGVDENQRVRFTDVTFASGLGEHLFPSQTAAWLDYDLDGDLDLFVGAESRKEYTAPCRLYRNSNGIFADVSGVAQANIVGQGVTAGDFNGDRYPDLYLSRLGEPNVLLMNQGDGTFLDVTSATATEEPLRSFPTWFFDYDNDGNLDLFASSYRGTGGAVLDHYRGENLGPEYTCRLYRNLGDGRFANVEELVGLTQPMLPMGSNFGDLANDGYQDFYLGTGDPYFSSIVPNILLSNEGGYFIDRTVESRLGHLQKGHAVSIADFDRDGDLDVFEQMGGAYRCDPYYDALFRNPGVAGRRWVSIKLQGRKTNRSGIGARVRVEVMEGDKSRSYYQWMNSGGSFGANPLELHFGLGQADAIECVEVFWPVTGETQQLRDVDLDSRVLITEAVAN